MEMFTDNTCGLAKDLMLKKGYKMIAVGKRYAGLHETIYIFSKGKDLFPLGNVKSNEAVDLVRKDIDNLQSCQVSQREFDEGCASLLKNGFASEKQCKEIFGFDAKNCAKQNEGRDQ